MKKAMKMYEGMESATQKKLETKIGKKALAKKAKPSMPMAGSKYKTSKKK